MPYQLQNLTPPQIARLDEVPISRQEQIIDKTGEPLRLVTSYYLVKNASADFSSPHETAEKLDALLYQLLTTKGFFSGNMIVENPAIVQKIETAVKTPAKVQPTKKPFSMNNYPLAKRFMPTHQQRVVKDFGEEREAILEEVETMLAGIPKSRAQSKKKLLEQTVFAHYFYGQSDWFILEYDKNEDLFFGYTILNGDSQMSEAGYISRAELTENGRVELDFYWKPVVLAEALHKADPGHFEAPEQDKQPETQASPKFKKGDITEYKGIPVDILSDGLFDTVANRWVYLVKAYQWPDADNVSEPDLKPIENTDWSSFKTGQSYRHSNGKTYEFDELIDLGNGGELASWKLGGKPVGAPIPNLPAYFKIEKKGEANAASPQETPAASDKSKRLRLAQAKAKAQAARIRILKLKSQKAA